MSFYPKTNKIKAIYAYIILSIGKFFHWIAKLQLNFKDFNLQLWCEILECDSIWLIMIGFNVDL